jgi:ornithine carbamoyltransferase
MTAKRDFATLSSLAVAELKAVLTEAHALKRDRARGRAALSGKAVAIVMEKASTRTRISFEVGVAELGGIPVVVTTQGSQLGRGEPVKDTARVLAGYCQAIVYRTSTTARFDEMCLAKVPVVNALTDDAHPVQLLADLMTVEEVFRARCEALDWSKLRCAFVGDGSSNMARSWIEAARLFGFTLALATPEGFDPPADEIALAGAHLKLTRDPSVAVTGARIVNTDVWTSMGKEDETARRLAAFRGFTVNDALMARAAADSAVLHCLPAHRGEEIEDSIIESPRSRIFDQAENRLHSQKALLAFLLAHAST